MTPLKPLVIAAFVLLAADFAAAETYKWTDADGKVHFSDAPPPDRKADPVVIRPAKPADPAAAPSQGWQSQLEESNVRGAQARDKGQKDKLMSGQMQKRCYQAKDQVVRMETLHRVYRLSDQGERIYLSDAEREKENKAAQDAVERYCR